MITIFNDGVWMVLFNHSTFSFMLKRETSLTNRLDGMFSSYPLIKEVLTRYICKILIPSIDEIGISSTLFIKLSMLTVVSFAKFKIPDLSVPSFLTICTIGAFIEVGRLVKSRMNNNNSRCFSSIGSTVFLPHHQSCRHLPPVSPLTLLHLLLLYLTSQSLLHQLLLLHLTY